MVNKIRIKRGLEANRSGVTPDEGEPLWTTDEKELYIGDGSTAGGIHIGNGDVSGPASAVDERVAIFDGTSGKLIKDSGKFLANSANNVPVLDASALLPLAQIPATLTGKDADTVDGIEGSEIFKKDGSVAMTGDLDMDGKSIILDADGDSKISSSDDDFIKIYTSGSYKFGIATGAVETVINFIPSADNTLKNGVSTKRWSDIYAVNTHWGDLGFTETTCPKCNKKFKLGDNIILKIIRFDEEDGGIMTVPIHLECAKLPSKIIKRKCVVKEDYYVWDEEKGDIVKKTRNKTAKKTVIKKKIKSGYELDAKTKKFWKLKKQAEKMIRSKVASKVEAIEEVEEEIEEVVYEEKEFEI